MLSIYAKFLRETDNKQFFHVYRTLVHLYIEVGREKDAEHLINRFKSIIKPNDAWDSESA
ncbi:hypothetical protein F4054_04005 [Candidatus Poribacteria bacterium]|nr:hypothetical protein [Candidatus Poribacteria bacterium]MYG07738.1 hypothetical protein [Candidatus Poribacteria bacterium]MYK21406.1 hypothetical protein [Candidatus Poribacteria bacterium]